jgi:hypothetical protein
VGRLQKLLTNAEAQLMGDTSQAPKRRYNLSVQDEIGLETFASADDIPTSGFPESTTSVRFVVECEGTPTSDGRPSQFHAKLSFRFRHGNRIVLKVRGPLARELSVGLLDRIQQLLQTQPIESWPFKRKSWVLDLAAFIVVLGGFAWLLITYDALAGAGPAKVTRPYWIFTSIVFSSAIYVALFYWLFPRCAFETNKWTKITDWRRWAKFGFASFVVFNVLVGALWKQVASLFS